MPFGLSNAPGVFQSHVNRCFSDMLDIFVQIYLDEDFLIYSLNKEDHVQHVPERVLQRVIDSNLAVNIYRNVYFTLRK